MAGDSGAHGDVGGLAVADLAHGDDVRVLTQNGAQAGGEGHAGLFVDLDLVDTVEVIFHRVLQSDQIHLLGVQLADHGVHGGGLTGAGGAHDEDNAVAVFQQGIEFGEVLAGQTDALGVQQAAGFVEHTDNHLLTVNGGQGGDTQVNVPLADADIASAVQGDLVLGNVHVAHDLDTGNDCALVIAGNHEDLTQHAVDTHADVHGRLAGLHVNIGSILADSVFQEAVHQSDGGRRTLVIIVNDGGGDLRFQFFTGAGQLLQRLLRSDGAVQVGNTVLDALHAGQQGHNLPPDGLADSIGSQEVQGVCHGQQQGVAIGADGDDVVLLGHVQGDQTDQIPVQLLGSQVDVLNTQLTLQQFVNGALGYQTLGHQNFVHPLVGLGLLDLLGGFQLILCNNAGSHQHGAKTLINHGQ